MYLDAYMRHYTLAAYANELLDMRQVKGYYLTMVRKVFKVNITYPSNLVFAIYPSTTLFESMNKWKAAQLNYQPKLQS